MIVWQPSRICGTMGWTPLLSLFFGLGLMRFAGRRETSFKYGRHIPANRMYRKPPERQEPSLSRKWMIVIVAAGGLLLGSTGMQGLRSAVRGASRPLGLSQRHLRLVPAGLLSQRPADRLRRCAAGAPSPTVDESVDRLHEQCLPQHSVLSVPLAVSLPVPDLQTKIEQRWVATLSSRARASTHALLAISRRQYIPSKWILSTAAYARSAHRR